MRGSGEREIRKRDAKSLPAEGGGGGRGDGGGERGRFDPACAPG